MNLSAPFIKRPVATTLLTLGLVLAGVLALRLLPIAPLPQVSVPTIEVTAGLPGADPQTMASAVAAPLERALGRISGVTEMTSTSALGATRIVLLFNGDRNLDGAARDVQAAINAARAELPPDMPANPRYREVSSADAPILILGLTSPTMTPAQMYASAATVLNERLSRIPGVGQVKLVGSSPPAVRVDIDPQALQAYGIGLEAVRHALVAANPNGPTGTFGHGRKHWQIATNGTLTGAAAVRDLVIGHHAGAVVHLGDVAQVRNGVQNLYATGVANGEPAVLAVVRRKPGANIIQTVAGVKAVLPGVRAALPQAMRVTVVTDRTVTVRASMRDAGYTLGIAVLLVVLVMLLFLRNVRAALVASVSAPLSLVGTFAVMYLLGFSLDNLSLMALTIAVGFAVDDAVVVVENIARHVEEGMAPRAAALTGSKEVGLTVLSMSTVLVAVFIPLLFLGGYVGLFVHEFAVTLAVVIAVSLVISLTTIPMLCACWFKPVTAGHQHSGWYRHTDRAMTATLRGYERSLDWVLDHQRVTLLALLAIVAATLYLYVAVPKGFFPRQDTGQLTGSVEINGSASYKVLRNKLDRFAAVVGADPAVAQVAAYAGGDDRNSGSLFATLKPRNQRHASADEVAARLNAQLAKIPGAEFGLKSVQDIRMGGRRSRSSYEYTVQADSARLLQTWEPRVRRALAALPQLRGVSPNGESMGLQTVVHINRDAAARHGVRVKRIDSVLHDAFAQRQVTTIYTPGNAYSVVLGLAPQYANSPAALDRLAVTSKSGQPVPLQTLANHHSRASALSIDHAAQFVSSTIAFDPAPGVSLSEAVQAVQYAVARLSLPSSVRGSFQGSAKAFRQVLDSEPVLIAAAFLTLFIALGVLYESYIHPLTILSTLPSAGLGALLALIVLGTDFNVIALIGIFALMGIVMKNAIMMVDFALVDQRHSGLNPQQAIRHACLLRFRPILMTSFAVLLAAIPLALSQGDGAEMRRPLGIVIGGGLIASQLLTLYTTPIIYLYLDRLGNWARRHLHRTPDRSAPATDGDFGS